MGNFNTTLLTGLGISAYEALSFNFSVSMCKLIKQEANLCSVRGHLCLWCNYDCYGVNFVFSPPVFHLLF